MTATSNQPAHTSNAPQRVVVTAGASGIGLAIAKAFLATGAQVFICDVSDTALDSALSNHPELQGAIANVGDPQSVEDFFKLSLAAMGGIDVLVNNAGIGGPRANIEDIEYQDWDDSLRINLSGMFYCIKQVIPSMKQQGSGCIINIATSSAKTALPQRLPYVASKVGVLGLSHNVARELGPFNIRCNSILPGKIDNPRGHALTERYAQEQGITFEQAEQHKQQFISMRCNIHPSEIGDTAVFLASDQAKHITAQEIAVDGNAEWEQ